MAPKEASFGEFLSLWFREVDPSDYALIFVFVVTNVVLVDKIYKGHAHSVYVLMLLTFDIGLILGSALQRAKTQLGVGKPSVE